MRSECFVPDAERCWSLHLQPDGNLQEIQRIDNEQSDISLRRKVIKLLKRAVRRKLSVERQKEAKALAPLARRILQLNGGSAPELAVRRCLQGLHKCGASREKAKVVRALTVDHGRLSAGNVRAIVSILKLNRKVSQ